MDELSRPQQAFPNVSLRWLLSAAGIVLLAAMAFAWMALCLLYWQGSWQLMYHPKAAITQTPASVGLTYDPIRFAAEETGTPQLTGWWIPSPDARCTALYLHGADGNLGDAVGDLAALHREGLAVFAFDYRGYGQSQPARPSEKQLRQDAEWALSWLTQTRHVESKNIVIYGSALGANLAAELAAQHRELAGVILDEPRMDAMAPVFTDSRSRLVPAHWLVADRYDLASPAAALRIPSLWLMPGGSANPHAFDSVGSSHTAVWLRSPSSSDPQFGETLHRWLDDLPAR
jgi:pimeloyl-ACP methyl ester carboxylesterase